MPSRSRASSARAAQQLPLARRHPPARRKGCTTAIPGGTLRGREQGEEPSPGGRRRLCPSVSSPPGVEGRSAAYCTHLLPKAPHSHLHLHQAPLLPLPSLLHLPPEPPSPPPSQQQQQQAGGRAAEQGGQGDPHGGAGRPGAPLLPFPAGSKGARSPMGRWGRGRQNLGRIPGRERVGLAGKRFNRFAGLRAAARVGRRRFGSRKSSWMKTHPSLCWVVSL